MTRKKYDTFDKLSMETQEQLRQYWREVKRESRELKRIKTN